MVPVGSCVYGTGRRPALNQRHAVLYVMPCCFAQSDSFMLWVYHSIIVHGRVQTLRQLITPRVPVLDPRRQSVGIGERAHGRARGLEPFRDLMGELAVEPAQLGPHGGG